MTPISIQIFLTLVNLSANNSNCKSTALDSKKKIDYLKKRQLIEVETQVLLYNLSI